jgi:hypothetical protein
MQVRRRADYGRVDTSSNCIRKISETMFNLVPLGNRLSHVIIDFAKRNITATGVLKTTQMTFANGTNPNNQYFQVHRQLFQSRQFSSIVF